MDISLIQYGRDQPVDKGVQKIEVALYYIYLKSGIPPDNERVFTATPKQGRGALSGRGGQLDIMWEKIL